MSFPKYEKYKDSGVEWLGEVPEGWDADRVKNIFMIGRGRVISNEEAKEDGSYPVFSSQTTNDGCLGYIETFDFDCDQLTWTTDGANAGTVFLRRGKHNCTNVCGTLQIKDGFNYNLRFGLYFLTFATQFYKRPDTNGAKIMNGEMAVVVMVVPTTFEQGIIAEFLDRETAKIDELVAEQQRLIDLLKEKRQSVISYAVTRGLNPNVKLKSSGIEWIGDVPEHWGVKPLKSVVFMRSGEQITANDIDVEGPYPVFGGNGLRGFTAKFTHDGYFPLIGRQGALCGNINYGNGQFWASEHAVVVTPVLECSIFWLGESLRTMNLGQYSVTAAQPGLSVEAIGNLRIPFPDFKEQQAIADFITTQTAKFDTLTAEAQRAIDLLQERRTALISAAVTGKIDVRQLNKN